MNDLTLQERLNSVEPPFSPKEDSLDIVEYWRALSKRRWSIIGLTILVAILAMLVVSNMRSLSGWHSLQQDFHRCRVCLVYSLKKPVPKTKAIKKMRGK